MYENAQYAELNEQMEIKHKILLERINIVRKQMILEEVCRDIIVIHEIILGLMKYRNIDKLKENELHCRQKYRKLFQDVIVDGVRRRYGH